MHWAKPRQWKFKEELSLRCFRRGKDEEEHFRRNVKRENLMERLIA